MKGDLHPIAFDLMQRLPVRVHQAPEPRPIRRTDSRSEYHRIYHSNNFERRRAYLTAKMREYRARSG